MREYVDFLGGQTPYDALEASDLEALARLIEVGDATTTAQVFLALMSRLGRLGYSTARDFVDLTDGDRALNMR